MPGRMVDCPDGEHRRQVWRYDRATESVICFAPDAADALEN